MGVPPFCTTVSVERNHYFMMKQMNKITYKCGTSSGTRDHNMAKSGHGKEIIDIYKIINMINYKKINCASGLAWPDHFFSTWHLLIRNYKHLLRKKGLERLV